MVSKAHPCLRCLAASCGQPPLAPASAKNGNFCCEACGQGHKAKVHWSNVRNSYLPRNGKLQEALGKSLRSPLTKRLSP